MADSNAVIDAIAGRNKQIETAKTSLVDLVSQQSKLLEEAAGLQEKGSVISSRGVHTTADAFKQEQLAELEAQNANIERARTTNFEQRSNDLLRTITEAGDRRTAALQEAERINSGSFLEQVVGMVTIPLLNAKAENANAIMQSAGEQLASVNQLMQASSKTSTEIQQAITVDSINSRTEALANDARVKAIGAKIEAIKTNAEGINSVLQLGQQQLSNSIQAYNIKAQEEQRAFQREQRDRLKAADLKEARNENVTNSMFDLANQARLANGLQPFPESQRDLIKAQISAAGPVGDNIRQFVSMGLELSSTGKVVQGLTPVEAADFRQKVGYQPTTPTEEKILGNVQQVWAADKAIKEAKSKQDKIIAANEAVLKRIQADQANVTTSASSLTPPVSWATLASSKAIQENKLYREVIGPQITDNIATQAIEPTDMYNRLVGAVVAGKGSVNEAAQLYHQYATISVGINNAGGLEKLTGFKQDSFGALLPQPRNGVINSAIANIIDRPINAVLNNATAIAGFGRPDLSNVAGFVAGGSLARVDGTKIEQVTAAFANSIAGKIQKEIK